MSPESAARLHSPAATCQSSGVGTKRPAGAALVWLASAWRLCGGCVAAGCAVAAVQSALAMALAACATWFALLALLLEPAAAKFAKGIARPDSPPMGWRSWNFFQCNVNQSIMEAQMDALG